MQERLLFEYAIIRLMPRVEREEFLNIGVILYCSSKRFLKMKFHLDQAKINMLCEDVDLSLIKKQLEAFQTICAGNRKGGTLEQEPINYRFRWLSANRSTIIQFSKVHPGLCLNPEDKLNHLFEQMVL